MKCSVVSDIQGLFALRDEWNALAADVPFRTHDWLSTWWMHYGAGQVRHRELHVVCVRTTDDTLIGIAPWYFDRSLSKGRTIRWLGDGEVCSDHLTLLCEPKHDSEVAEVLAGHLLGEQVDWDLLELEGVDSADATVEAFACELRKGRCLVQRRGTPSCWKIDLPGTWPKFLQMQSLVHRKQLERLICRADDEERCVWHRVTTHEQFAHAWSILVDFHQRRWQSVGEPGVFASQAFRDFHEDAAQRMLARGQLQLSWLELDGAPVAAEYDLCDRHATYVYQGGFDPERLDDKPGRILKILSIRDAIASGRTCYDFLRGDEPYKARWGAMPYATFRLRAVPPRQTARVRATAFDAARHVKGLIRAGSDWLRGGEPKMIGAG